MPQKLPTHEVSCSKFSSTEKATKPTVPASLAIFSQEVISSINITVLDTIKVIILSGAWGIKNCFLELVIYIYLPRKLSELASNRNDTGKKWAETKICNFTHWICLSTQCSPNPKNRDSGARIYIC